MTQEKSMSGKIIVKILKVLLLVMLLTLACSDNDNGGTVSYRLYVTDSSDTRTNTFSQSDSTVTITFEVINDSNDDLEIYSMGGPCFDFIVSDSEVEIWRLSYDAIFCQIHFTIKPGEEKVISVQWDLTDNLGNPVPPGNYLLTAYLFGDSDSHQHFIEIEITP